MVMLAAFKPHIVVIGAGQIGSRHLQSLAQVNRSLSISVVDPSIESLKMARRRWNEVNFNKSTGMHHRVMFIHDVHHLPGHITIAIIATGARIRPQVIRQLLSKCQVQWMILEKVVFQSESLFTEMYDLFQQRKVKVWVNCPWRTFPFFQKLKWHFDQSNSAKLQYYANASQLGIGTNTIHHLDLMAYLSGDSDFQFDRNGLDDELIKSRHNDAIEFTGTLSGHSKKGKRIVITSYRKGSSPLWIHLESESVRCSISFQEQKAQLRLASHGWQMQELDCPLYKQSELTASFVQQLLENGNCPLTPYADSWRLHKPILQVLLSQYEKSTKKEHATCPIT